MRSASSLLIVSVIAGAGFLSAAGCSEEEGADSKAGPATNVSEAGVEAKNFFVQRVYTPLNNACTKCHNGAPTGGSNFMAADAESSYARIEGSVGLIADPTRSPLIQHQHKDKTITLSPELRNLLTQWLNLEASARGLEGAVKTAPTLAEAYKAYAQCMNFDVWTYYRMGDLPFAQTDLEGPCIGCHSTGQGGAFLTASAREFFEKSKEFPYIQKFVVGQVDSEGRFLKLIPANRFIDKANEPCAEGRTDCHPTYGLPPKVQEAITGFILTTLQNLAGGTCQTGVPQLVNPDAGADGGKDGGS